MKRVCLLTGGSSGIGKATAALLTQNGFTVYELSRNGADADGIRHITADVTNPDQVRAAVAEVLADQGQIDLLVNNAGFGISGAVEFTDPADAYAQLNVNFFGALHCIQAVLPTMRAQKSGHIVNISSVAAPIAIPFQAFYSATKSATNSLTLATSADGKASAAIQTALDVNGRVIGTKTVNNGVTGSFVVSADVFGVETPGNPADRLEFRGTTGLKIYKNNVLRIHLGFKP